MGSLTSRAPSFIIHNVTVIAISPHGSVKITTDNIDRGAGIVFLLYSRYSINVKWYLATEITPYWAIEGALVLITYIVTHSCL